MAVLEAAASELACLVTLAAFPFTILKQYQAGIVVDPTPESIAKGIQQFAAMSTADLEAMGRRARQMVETEFNWKKIAADVVEAYGTHVPKN